MILSVNIPASSNSGSGQDWQPDTIIPQATWGVFWGTDSVWHKQHAWFTFDYQSYFSAHRIAWNQITSVELTIKLSSGGRTDALWTSINRVKRILNFTNYPPTWNSYMTSPTFPWQVPGGTGTDDMSSSSMVLYKFLDNNAHTFNLPLADMRYIFDYHQSTSFMIYCPYQPGDTMIYLHTLSLISTYLTVYYSPGLSGDVVMF